MAAELVRNKTRVLGRGGRTQEAIKRGHNRDRSIYNLYIYIYEVKRVFEEVKDEKLEGRSVCAVASVI